VFNFNIDKFDLDVCSLSRWDILGSFEVNPVISSSAGFGFNVKLENTFNRCQIYMKPSVKGIVITMVDVRSQTTKEVYPIHFEESHLDIDNLKQYVVDFIIQNEFECREISW